jgi:Pyruvate/2-oxoacid:ferredoxin oxidoreductase delta subunit
MSDGYYPQHYVCTHEQARELIAQHSQFWLCTCGCRAEGNGCKRSESDVCLTFNAEALAGQLGHREVSRSVAESVEKAAQNKHLVARPFRNPTNPEQIDGICHCCDDCCSYFIDPSEACDRGSFKEATDLDACNNCGKCVEVCYFGARSMVLGALSLQQDACFGCGLCVDVCPTDSIMMSQRVMNAQVLQSDR